MRTDACGRRATETGSARPVVLAASRGLCRRASRGGAVGSYCVDRGSLCLSRSLCRARAHGHGLGEAGAACVRGHVRGDVDGEGAKNTTLVWVQVPVQGRAVAGTRSRQLQHMVGRHTDLVVRDPLYTARAEH